MSRLTALFEPEELIGSFWHRSVAHLGKEVHYAEAAAKLEDLQKRLSFFYRGLGGEAGVEIKAITKEKVEYRQKWFLKAIHNEPVVTRARFDKDHLFLPQEIALLPERADNELLYKWLVAWAVVAEDIENASTADNGLQRDIAFIRQELQINSQIFSRFPGMKKVYQKLSPKLLEQRPSLTLPAPEAALENCIRAILANAEPAQSDTAELTAQIWHALHAPKASLDRFTASTTSYSTFLPVALWGEVSQSKRLPPAHRKPDQETMPQQEEETEEQEGRSHKAKREESEQVERKDPLLLHRFEAILSWAEMMNLNRGVDDDDEHTARRALDDQEEIGLANISHKPATKLKFDLDLSPEDVLHERLAAKFSYPEWDYRKNAYYQDHCRVLAAPAALMEAGETWQPDKEARKRIRAVKRQFEALRPRRERFYRQIEGEDVDIDAALRAHCDFVASGNSSQRVFSTMRENTRDLAISVLIDVSRSTESWINGQQVIEIARETLMALALGLAATGDDNAIYSFSSLRRDRVEVSTIKDFSENLGPDVFSRIGALKPGFYTRLGTAIRHVGHTLSQTHHSHRLLLVITDGKPNDLDHYEGRYGVEDSMMAVRETRRNGMSIFGITIDKHDMAKTSGSQKSQNYFAYIFGQNAHSMTRQPHDLIKTLPLIYRHLIT